MRGPAFLAALCCLPLTAALVARSGTHASAAAAQTDAAPADPVARAFYARRLEPRSVILHGAGQSDEKSFAAYTRSMGADRAPMLSMSYVDLKDDMPAYFMRLRADLAQYPALIVPQIGLSFNSGDAAKHDETAVATGQRDTQLHALCEGLRSLDRPIFLRIGYEFNGSWNGYAPTAYIGAFRHVVQTLRGCRLENVAAVWDWSADAELDAERGGGSVTDASKRWENYYPGDEWVDWWALNLFSEDSIKSSATKAFLAEAARHRFPVMVGESTPQGHSVTEGKPLIHAWFVPYFALLKQSPQIKAFCYIDWDWREYPQWSTWGDARLRTNADVLAFYRDEIHTPLYASARDRAETLRLLNIKPRSATGKTGR